MSPEFTAFLIANSTLLIIAVVVLAIFGVVQWRKVRLTEQEHEFKQALLDKGVPIADIEKVLATKSPPRRGLFEQFGALSGGAKAGIIFALIVAFSMIGSTIQGIVFWSSVREQHAVAAQHQQQQNAAPQQPPPVVPPVEKSDAIAGHASYLDLQPVANHKLDEPLGNDKGHSHASLPQKRRDFGGVPFQVGPGYVRLLGKNRPELPAEVGGIRVGFVFDKLHVLHGTEYGAFGDATHRFHVADDTEVGRFRLTYEDGEERVISVVYGQDVRDVWNWDRSRATPRGRVVWTGRSPSATKEGVTLRLYLTTWDNPRPEAEVKHIDYISADTAASPVCIAMTVERVVK